MTEPTGPAMTVPPSPPAAPELDKMHAVHELSQSMGEFLDWYRGHGGRLVRYGVVIDEVGREHEDRLLVDFRSIETILAEYFGVDLAACDRERQALLEYIRAVQTPTLFGA